MKYCFKCRKANNWPGGFQTAPQGPCESPFHQTDYGTRDVSCYQYPDHLLEGLPNEVNAVAQAEEASG